MGNINLFCPTSIKACALRITKLQPSGLPWDPAIYLARTAQGSAFVEVQLAPITENGDSIKIRQGGASTFAVLHQDFDQIHGFDVTIKYCGFPSLIAPLFPNGLFDFIPETNEVLVHGAALRDGVSDPCPDNPLAIEVWSKNIGDPCPDGRIAKYPWIHWVLPLTDGWVLSSNLTFNTGALELEVKGRAVANPWWYPSFPGPEFNSYVSEGDFPSGPPPAVLPVGVSADEWTLSDWQMIRASGPLGWRGVTALPSPLDDCELIPNPDNTPPGPCDNGTFRFAEGSLAGTPFVGSPYVGSPPYVDAEPLVPPLPGTGAITPWEVSDGVVVQPPVGVYPDYNVGLSFLPFVPSEDCCVENGRSVKFEGSFLDWAESGGVFLNSVPATWLVWENPTELIFNLFYASVSFVPGSAIQFSLASFIGSDTETLLAVATHNVTFNDIPETELPNSYVTEVTWLFGSSEPAFAFTVAVGDYTVVLQTSGGEAPLLVYGEYPAPLPEAKYVGGEMRGSNLDVFFSFTGTKNMLGWEAQCEPWVSSGETPIPYEQQYFPPVDPCAGGTFSFSDGPFTGTPYVGAPYVADPSIYYPSATQPNAGITPWEVVDGVVVQPPVGPAEEFLANLSIGLVPFVPDDCCTGSGRTIVIEGELTAWAYTVETDQYSVVAPLIDLVWTHPAAPSIFMAVVPIIRWKAATGYSFFTGVAVTDTAGVGLGQGYTVTSVASDATPPPFPTKYRLTLKWNTGAIADPSFWLNVELDPATSGPSADFYVTGAAEAILGNGTYSAPVPEVDLVGAILSGSFASVADSGNCCTIESWQAGCNVWVPSESLHEIVIAPVVP